MEALRDYLTHFRDDMSMVDILGMSSRSRHSSDIPKQGAFLDHCRPFVATYIPDRVGDRGWSERRKLR